MTTSSTPASSEGVERGYTSDSELYESANHYGNKVNAAGTSNRTNINGEMEIKPLPDSHGSWVLVSHPTLGSLKVNLITGLPCTYLYTFKSFGFVQNNRRRKAYYMFTLCIKLSVISFCNITGLLVLWLFGQL